MGPFSTTATNRPVVPALGNHDDGEIGGMMIGRGNRSTRKKPAQCCFVHHKPHMPAGTRTRAAAVGSQKQMLR
jgi:hypothetical protein